MFEIALNSINQVFPACAGWFTSIFNQTGATPYYLATVFIVLVVRFLIKPLVGNSDISGNYIKRRKS